MSIEASSAEVKVATSLLQALVVVIPVWIALVKFILNDDGKFDNANLPNFRSQLSLLGATSYLAIGIGIVGIYRTLAPVSAGLRQAFSGLLLWYVISGLLAALMILEHVSENNQNNKRVIWEISKTGLAAAVILILSSFLLSVFLL